jgi:hypothetical protein
MTDCLQVDEKLWQNALAQEAANQVTQAIIEVCWANEQ